MKGSQILLSNEPRGRKIEGFISGTPKPGTVMQIKAATEPVGGRHTWEVYNRDADGNRPQGPIAILTEDFMLGKTYDDAYVDGHHGHLYIPLPGDEMNMRVTAAGTGTGDAQAIAGLYIPNDGDGLLVATTGSPEIECFVCMETVADVVAAGTLVHVMFTNY